MADAATLALALDGCVLADRSDLARIRATGRDILDLLHRLSTQDLESLRVGEGRPAVLTSPKGRIVERLFVHRVAEREVLMVAGAGRAQAVLAHLAKFTFAEQTGVSDASSDTAHLALVGPAAPAALARAGLPEPHPYGSVEGRLGGRAVVVLGEDGVSSQGRGIVASAPEAEAVRAALAAAAPAADAATVEAWRILRGHPASGRELTEDWNPLEAGLRDHVSFTKGCYVGQEVVARLNTYDKVSRRLVVLRFEPGTPLPAEGAEVTAGERTVGRVTSVASLPDGGGVALAYVRSRDLTGSQVRAGASAGAIVSP